MNIVWIFFIVLATKGLISRAAAIPGSEVQMGPEGQQLDLMSFLNRGEENSSFVTYQTSSFEIKSFEIVLGEVKDELYYGLD